MLREKRFDYILKQLEKKDFLSYEELAVSLEVSEDTVRRDVDSLHKNGLISKVRGGAMQRSKNPLSFQERNSYLKTEKDKIALKAQQFVKEGETIFMDGGTTICAVGSYFPTNIKLRIITTNIMLFPVFREHSNIELILLGGTYSRQTGSIIGESACKETEKFIADVYFMGTCGVDIRFGISAVVQQDAEVKRAMLRSAKKVVALANQDRLRTTEAHKICNLSQVNVLITNLDSNDEALDEFRNLSIELV